MTQEKAQHTPTGPWSIDCNLGVFPEDGMPITDDKTDNEICVVWPQDSSDDAQAANARLIAAAPDLLAALDYLLGQTVDMDLKHGIELTEGETEAREQALAAIKKATNPNP